jgi:hypothetical protein
LAEEATSVAESPEGVKERLLSWVAFSQSLLQGIPAENLERINHMATRTTHRSSSGKKLYAVRDASGRFKDIQTYERAHRADLKRKSQGEVRPLKKH